MAAPDWSRYETHDNTNISMGRRPWYGRRLFVEGNREYIVMDIKPYENPFKVIAELRTENAELRGALYDEKQGITANLREQGLDSLQAELAEAKKEVNRLHSVIDKLLAHCPDGECCECAEAVCPYGEPMHFYHDGCPACTEHHAIKEKDK